MARPDKLGQEHGFTLIELLVVILIIGILAAIALPTFLSQQSKGQDANAKSDVRNAVAQMESCYVGTQDFRDCPDAETQLPAGATLTSAAVAGFEVAAVSKSGITFTITKTVPGTYVRTCTPVQGTCRVADADGNQW